MTLRSACLATGFLCLFATTARAQEKRPLTIVDLIEIPGIGDPQISPGGAQVLYSRTDADWEANGTKRHIWRIGLDGSSPVQMTNGEKGESSPRWSPDGTRIAFLAERHESERQQIFLIPNDGGEARVLTDHPTAVGSIEWSPDGRWIYFVAQREETEAEEAREAVEDNVFRYEEDQRHSDLWRVAVDTGETGRISDGKVMVRGYSVSGDGSLVLAELSPTPQFDDMLSSELWLMAADGSNPRRLTDNRVGEGSSRLSPDNSHALFIANTNDGLDDFYYNQRLFVIPTAGGDPVSLLPGGGYDVNGAAWSTNGESIYFRANTGVRQQLFMTPFPGAVTAGGFGAAGAEPANVLPLTRGDHTVGSWVFDPLSDTHVYAVSDPTNAGDLWTFQAGRTGDPRRVTHVYDYLSAEFRLPRVEAVHWNGEDGVEIEGLLYYPLDYVEGTRYPLVVQTHGGPPASDKFGFSRSNDYEAVYSARGWFVFKPNYRGSTGYGDEFLRNMVGHYFDQAHKDVMAGVDNLIDRGLVDGDRMAKMGWSAGGHMTNKIITYTDRFKAAASGAGAVNWMSMYAQSDVRIYRTPWFGGTPWSEDAPIDRYMADSPLFDLHKVTTPTIILVGENDNRVPMPQSVELYRGLKDNGVPTHLYVAPRQGHGWQELQQRLFKANVELDWFDQWVLGREYEWEKSPVHPDAETKPVTTAAGGGD